LSSWLKSFPDLEEVSAWYSAWKSAFPVALVENNERIRQPFNFALEMMNVAMLADEDDQEGLNEEARKWDTKINVETSYFKQVEMRKEEFVMTSRLDDLAQKSSLSSLSGSTTHLQDHSMTFKQMIEALAVSNNCTFLPRDKIFEGKQVWTFNKTLCYMHDNVLFAKKENNNWVPVSLEELLLISQ